MLVTVCHQVNQIETQEARMDAAQLVVSSPAIVHGVFVGAVSPVKISTANFP